MVLSEGTTLIRGLLRRSPTDPSLTDSTCFNTGICAGEKYGRTCLAQKVRQSFWMR